MDLGISGRRAAVAAAILGSRPAPALAAVVYARTQGIPFFIPLFDPRSEFDVFGPSRNGKTVKDMISGQMQQPYFPVTAEMVFRAQLKYREVKEGDALHVTTGPFHDGQVGIHHGRRTLDLF